MNPVILTADNPEPPEESVVLDSSGGAWWRDGDHWFRGLGQKGLSYGGLKLGGSPLTLIHRGPDPEPPTTWKFSDPEPPMGTVVAQSGLFPMTWDSEFWVGLLGMKLTLKPGITYQVLRWGWDK